MAESSRSFDTINGIDEIFFIFRYVDQTHVEMSDRVKILIP